MLVFSMLAFPVEKVQAEIITGVTEGNIKYTIDTEKKVITIEGEGTLGADFPGSEGEVWDIPDMHWEIGEGITRIGCVPVSAFKNMKSIHLPESLKVIDDRTFYLCTNLESIEIPVGVEKIGKTAIERCINMKTVINNSAVDVSLPDRPGLIEYERTNYYYYVDGKRAVIVPPGKTAIGKERVHIASLFSRGGTMSKYNLRQYVYFKIGKPLKLPYVKWKGKNRVFCGWTREKHSNYAWRTITNEDTGNPYGTTMEWCGNISLYAQFAKVEMKKLGKKKLKVRVSKWRDADQLEIRYSTNKNFKNYQSIIVKSKQLMWIWPNAKKYKKKHYKLYYNQNKRRLSLTLYKLKANKKYYFRFQYSGYDGINADDYFYCVASWFKKNVKM